MKISRPVSAVLLILLASCGNPPVRRPNVLLVIIDTLRADHLGCYGYERDTSPTIDSLAAKGTLWMNFQAQAPWTLPATASIFTGLTPRQHGTGRRPDGDHVLDSNVPVLAELFQSSGYQTMGIFNVALLGEQMGFARGFDRYFCADYGVYRADSTVDQILGWIDSSSTEAPFLAVVHIFDVHQPYDPPPPYSDMFMPGDTLSQVYWQIDDIGRIAHPEHLQHFVSRYDGGIRWVDSQLSRLLGGLRSRSLTDSTIILLTADHGEEFLERGWVGHGGNLYQQILHVPLIMAGPGIGEGRLEEEPAGQIDILPTLLSLCSINDDLELPGRDLYSSELQGPRSIPASGLMFNGTMLGGVPVAEVRYGNMKGVVVRSGSHDSYFMFDLESDSGEVNPMEADSQMVLLLDDYRSTPRIYDPATAEYLDSSSVDALKDLGYI